LATLSLQLRAIGENDVDYWKAKPHAEQKYTILGKYLAACGTFARKYGNFVYVDTHGGSGLIEMENDIPLLSTIPQRTEGSPLIAVHAVQAWSGKKQFPCHIIEIHPGRYDTLHQSTAGFSWVHTHLGDCNVLLFQILSTVPAKSFVLCFIDPDGLVYDGPGSSGSVPQFTWLTMEQIASRQKVEILLNFPLEAILRTAGYCRKQTDQPAAQAMSANLTTYFGCEDWQGLCSKRQFLNYYLHRLQKMGFGYLGAYYVNRGGLPLYYLVYGTKSKTGATIMRDVMRAKWKAVHPIWAAEAAQVGLEHSLEEFIFDNENLLTQGDYPPNWEEIAQAVKDAVGWKCEECGTPHSPDSQAGCILTVHHIDGNPANCVRENLVVLCQRCQLRLQADLDARGMTGEARQLSLFPEWEIGTVYK
jgi:three-Cys-motif partner protein